MLQKGLGPEILHECLSALIGLCDQTETSSILCGSHLSQLLWTPVISYAAPTPDSIDEKWSDVYFLCCQLNTAMLKSQKYYYLDDALNFWGIHGQFLAMKLCALTDLIHNCYLQSPEQNFQSIKQLLTHNFSILHAMSEMVPYFQAWRVAQLQTLNNLMVRFLSFSLRLRIFIYLKVATRTRWYLVLIAFNTTQNTPK